MANKLVFYHLLFLHGLALSSLPITIEKIGERAILLSCQESNVMAVLSSKGVIVIDTNRSPWIMQEIRREIEKYFPGQPFIYVINTHGHQDHASGNQVFPEAEIVGHENCAEFMRNFPANLARSIWLMKRNIAENNQPPGSPAAEKLAIKKRTLSDLETNYRITPPTRTFRERLELSCGDLNLILIYPGPAHTTSDIMIHIPKIGLLAVGDLFTSAAHFGFRVNKMVDVAGLVRCIDLVLQDSVATIIPGHGRVLDKSSLVALGRLLQEQKLDPRESASK